jgi:hypothetical protein
MTTFEVPYVPCFFLLTVHHYAFFGAQQLDRRRLRSENDVQRVIKWPGRPGVEETDEMWQLKKKQCFPD